MEINTGVVEGKFPRRALHALLDWYTLHNDRLIEDWQLAERHAQLKKIPPLE